MGKKLKIDLNARLYEGGPSRIGWLRDMMDAKGVGPDALHLSLKNPPPGLSYGVLASWVYGNTSNATWAHWIAVKHGIRAYGRRKELQKKDRVDLTETLYPGSLSRISWLRQEMDAKDVGAGALHLSLKNPPPGLSQNTLDSWVHGNVNTATWAHWIAVKHGIRAYEKRVDLTERLYKGGPSRISWLRQQMNKKDVGATRLFNSLADKPEGMQKHTIESWDNGSSTIATWAHWIAVKHGIRAYNPKGTGPPLKKRMPVEPEAPTSAQLWAQEPSV